MCECRAALAELEQRVAALEGANHVDNSGKLVHAYSPAFLAFWAAYESPRRRNKPEAWRQWRRLKLDADPGKVTRALDGFRSSAQWRDGFEPEPARWLKSEPWLDEPTSEPPQAGSVDPWEVRR